MGRGTTVGIGLPIKGGIVENTGGRLVVTGVSTVGVLGGENSQRLPAKGGLQAQSVPSATPPFKHSGKATNITTIKVIRFRYILCT